jgi:hypothetical protein
MLSKIEEKNENNFRSPLPAQCGSTDAAPSLKTEDVICAASRSAVLHISRGADRRVWSNSGIINGWGKLKTPVENPIQSHLDRQVLLAL